MIYGSIGEAQKAMECFKQVIVFPAALNLDTEKVKAQSHWNVMTSPLLEPIQSDFEQAISDLSKFSSFHGKSWILFAIAFGYERLSDFKSAFEYFKKANAFVWDSSKLDKEKYIEWFSANYERLVSNYSKPINKPKQSKKIVFVCGLPRSGTTLVESVLSKSPGVFAGGESNGVSNAVKKLKGIDKISEEKELNIFFSIYRDSNDFQSISEEVFVDKMPNNFIYADYLLRMCPDSLLINTFKEPLDACLSLFRQHFGSTMGHLYAYSLPSIVIAYKWHEIFMNKLSSLYPDRVLNVSYEDLVTNGESNWKQIFSFIGLGWDTSYMDFYKDKRVVKTLSNYQVREKVSKKYLRRSESYGDLLGDITYLLSKDLNELCKLLG